MLPHFETTQWLPYPVERVFSFFADPANLPRLMPPWQRARIDEATIIPPPPSLARSVHASTAVTAGSGTRLTLTFRPFPYSPIRLSWDALIEDFHWNQGFCDVQLRGPFRSWRHCHSVEPAASPLKKTHASPGTMLRDAVDYELPLGPFSALADTLFVQRQLAATFRYRQQRTMELLAKQIM
jgi:ligand-binding SRPBCC domain-containing protein